MNLSVNVGEAVVSFPSLVSSIANIDFPMLRMTYELTGSELHALMSGQVADAAASVWRRVQADAR